MPRKSTLCVFGVGGVGGYFGGRIVAALQTQVDAAWETHFVARGEHLERIRRHGLALETPQDRLTCVPSSAVAKLDEAPVPDVVLVCVKGYDLEDAARQLANHSHAGTIVVPLLNGIDIYDRLRPVIPSGIILPACVFVGTHIERPGLVVQAGSEGAIVLGADPRHPDFVPHALLGLLDRASIGHRWLDNPRPAIWEKFVFISAFGLVTAATGKTLGEVLASPDLTAEAMGIMEEVVQLARCEHIDLGADAVARALAKAGDFPPETKTSLQRDIEAGRVDERDVFGGAILRLGEAHGIGTPHTTRVYAQLGEGRRHSAASQ